MISVGSEVQILPGPFPPAIPPDPWSPDGGGESPEASSSFRRTSRSRGRSSAGRAPALQAGGHRFEPGRLQRGAPPKRSACTGSSPVEEKKRLYRGEVTRSWRCRCSPRGTPPLHDNRHSFGGFVLCQGESGSGASLDACDGRETCLLFHPAVWLMSDRESRVTGQTVAGAPPGRTASVQGRCVNGQTRMPPSRGGCDAAVCCAEDDESD